MSRTPIPHRWDLSPADAITLQKALAEAVDTDTAIPLADIRRVAGVDVSVKNGISRAAVVLLRYPSMEVIHTALAEMLTPFPYISGLLSFREGAVILEACRSLPEEPDVLMFDGMGIMHPRRVGIASHIGLWLSKPTVGVGKTYLLGQYEEPGIERGAYSVLTHQGEALGVVLRTRAGVKPVFVSPGHLATIDTARELTIRCTGRYRLPIPTREAHLAAGKGWQ